MKYTYTEDITNIRFQILVDRLTKFRIEFTENIFDKARELKLMGLDNETLTQEILNYAFENDKVLTLPNKESREMWNFFKSVAQNQVWGGLPIQDRYTWEYNPGAKHCVDCLDRNGKVKTLSEWESLGVPGSGATACHDNCMCDLIPEGA